MAITVELGPGEGRTFCGRLRYELEPCVSDEARIILTDGINVYRYWDYRSAPAACLAWDQWGGGEGEPAGYTRTNEPRRAPRLVPTTSGLVCQFLRPTEWSKGKTTMGKTDDTKDVQPLGYNSDARRWERIRQSRADLHPRQVPNLEALMHKAGVADLEDLPVRQAAALVWLSSWEDETVYGIIDALASATLEPARLRARAFVQRLELDRNVSAEMLRELDPAASELLDAELERRGIDLVVLDQRPQAHRVVVERHPK